MNSLRNLSLYTAAIVAVSIAYFVYIKSNIPIQAERETFLSELGEGIGNIALFAFGLIYGRSLLKLAMQKGKFKNRLLPTFGYWPEQDLVKKILVFLNRTHIYVGIATVALVGLHIAMVGLPMEILFFPVVLGLVLWQSLFGWFISTKYTPKQIKKVSYLVHAQFVTGIMIGVFAYFGHLAID